MLRRSGQFYNYKTSYGILEFEIVKKKFQKNPGKEIEERLGEVFNLEGI